MRKSLIKERWGEQIRVSGLMDIKSTACNLKFRVRYPKNICNTAPSFITKLSEHNSIFETFR